MTIKLIVLGAMIPFSIPAMAMNFFKDNPEDKVIPKTCVKELIPYWRLWNKAVGYTPLSLFDMCKRNADLVNKACQEDEQLKQMPDCLPFAKKQRHANCKKLYKKSLEIINQYQDFEDEEEQTKAQIEHLFKSCVKSCNSKAFKYHKLNESFFDLETRNHARHFKYIFNSLLCFRECMKENQLWVKQAYIIKMLEHAHMQEAAEYNAMTKKMYSENK